MNNIALRYQSKIHVAYQMSFYHTSTILLPKFNCNIFSFIVGTYLAQKASQTDLE